MHLGFLKSWTANGLDTRVVSRIKEIIQSPDFHCTRASVCITGVAKTQLALGKYILALPLEPVKKNSRIPVEPLTLAGEAPRAVPISP